MQMVILAGGLATRLRPLTIDIPKSMILVEGKPFLEYQIALLKKHKINDIVLCVGHLGENIQEYFGDGARFGVQLSYSWERGRLLGTGGALKNAESLLDEQFFLMYGDSYLLLDYEAIWRFFQRFDKLGLMVVYRNDGRYDRSNVVVEENLVGIYDKTRQLPGMVHIDEGLSIFRREALSLVPMGESYPLDGLFQQLIQKRELLAYETSQRFYEVGSYSGLEEFRSLAASEVITP